MSITPNMPITEFFARLRPIQQRARDRAHEYLNHGDDTGFESRVFYELCITLMQDNERLHAEIDKLNQVLGTGTEE
jgi:hypothetical protein